MKIKYRNVFAGILTFYALDALASYFGFNTNLAVLLVLGSIVGVRLFSKFKKMR